MYAENSIDPDSRLDLELVQNLKSGKNINESLEELVQRHSGIFITMINSYTPINERSEMIGDKEYYIYNAALKYDESKNTKFPTYLGSETRWMCLNNYNKNKRKNEIDLDSIENLGVECMMMEKYSCSDSAKKILQMAKRHPDKRVYTIFKLRYSGSGRNKLTPWSKVCKPVELSVQGCINVHDQALKKIKQELKKEI